MKLPQKESQLNSDKHISTSIVLHEYVVYKDHPNPGNQYLPVTTSIKSINKTKQKKYTMFVNKDLEEGMDHVPTMRQSSIPTQKYVSTNSKGQEIHTI